MEKCLSKFPESIHAVQSCLDDSLFRRPIEMNISSDRFFGLMYHNIFRLIDFEYLFNQNEYQKKLANLLEVMIKNDILESIQPDVAGKTSNRMRHLDMAFFKIGSALQTCKKLEESLCHVLLKLIRQVDDFENYRDQFDSKSFTVNYRIVVSLSSCMLNADADERIVKCLLEIWARLYQQDCEDFKRNYYTFVSNAARLNEKLVASCLSKQIYTAFLENIKDNYLTMISLSILPWSSRLFMAEFADRYFKLVMENFDELYLSNCAFLFKITEYCPEFYLHILTEERKFRLTYLIEKSKSSLLEHANTSTLGLITQLLKVLKEKKDLIEKFYTSLIQHRHEFWIFVFNHSTKMNDGKIKYEMFKPKNFTLEWMINSIGGIYFELLKNAPTSQEARTLAKQFIDELLKYILNIEPKSDRPCQILDILRGIGEYDNKVYLDLLKPHRELFVEIKSEMQTNPNAINSVNALLDLIDNRNIETFENKLIENEQNIAKINENLEEKGAEIRALDENVRANEKNISSLKTEVGEIGTKVDVLTKQLEQQNLRIDQFDLKTVFNVPPWCKKLQASIQKNRQDWILIAQRLNFSQRDIKGINPCDYLKYILHYSACKILKIF